MPAKGLLCPNTKLAALAAGATSLAGEAGVKRLARAVDAAVHAVHAGLIDGVAPAAQLAAFRLGELRGLAAPCNAPALAALGLKVCGAGRQAADMRRTEGGRTAVRWTGDGRERRLTGEPHSSCRMSRCPPLCPQATELGAAEKAALALLLDAERLRRRVVAVGAQYRALWSWLLTLVRRRAAHSAGELLTAYAAV